ncbi:uncharacterized protein LOC105192943 [Solenopsis invicta]|uniref:uncharacterized protein LOC105192943 n=1 Tax=Solenopsis invicta TaxID=13686 RepID=UPI000595988E|nr:uncharacterized protein LOC105192943 [Solenopsis invicta]XP_011155533.1 uncharacterized protein LOC105192943 [Solenopsis invicta]XP_011155534.1 uncharacterized protein LOC105192943 [Solenopsis invicta]XP_011155535.1 uncharacterized protein LOC105192943 [Solenopsis invicta]
MLSRLLEKWFQVRNKQDALHIRRRLSLLYAFMGWNAFGVLFYIIMKDRIPEDSKERRIAYGLLSGMSSNIHVYQVSGLTLTNDFDLKSSQEEKKSENENTTTKTDDH